MKSDYFGAGYGDSFGQGSFGWGNGDGDGQGGLISSTANYNDFGDTEAGDGEGGGSYYPSRDGNGP